MVDKKAPIPFPDRELEPAEVEAEQPEELSAADRLHAFEEKHFVDKDHPRHGHHIERGIGSKFDHPRHAPHRAHHAALVALVAAEAEHKKASAAEESAHTKLEAAVQHAESTEAAIED